MTSMISRHAAAGLARLIFGISAALVLCIQPAFAFSPIDAADLFGTTNGDPFTSIFLNQLFGPLFPAMDGSSTQTVFSSIIGYFNIIVLMIGGMMFFYNATVGVMQSAHEGSVLGQRWSSLWAPLRVVFAVGLVVPVPGLGGYNLVQSGVAYVVKGSTNVASLVWTETARMVVDGSIPITSAPPTISPAIFSTMYDNAACKAIANEQMRRATPAGQSPIRVGDEISGGPHQSVVTTVTMGHGGPSYTNAGICGTYKTPDLPAYVTSFVEGQNQGGGLPDDPNTRDQIRQEFVRMHGDSMEYIQRELDAVAEGMLPALMDPSQPNPDVTGSIASITMSSRSILLNGVERIMDIALGGAERKGQAARDALLTRIEGSCSETASAATGSDSMSCYGEGWIGAGSWYMMLAQLNNELSSLTGAQGSATSGKYIAFDSEEISNLDLYVASGGKTGFFGGVSSSAITNSGMATAEEAQLIFARYKQVYNNSTAGLAALGFPMAPDHLHSLTENVTSNGILDKIPGFKTAFQSTTEWAIAHTSPSNFGSDPMIGLTVIGKMLIYLSGIMIGIAGVTGFLSGGAVATMLMPFVATLVTAGSTLAYILPMTPFIFWVLAVTGYFLLIVEAIVAVNLWALAHMRMDGDGISGEAGRQGWLMLLSIMMTPVLMIFGFLVGMSIFRITSSLLDIGFNQALSGILGGGLFNGLVALLVYSILIAVMYMVLLERSFSLVTEFPGRVLRWMGASAELTNGEEGKARMAVAGAAVGIYKTAGMAASGSKQIGARMGNAEQVQGQPQGTQGHFRRMRERKGSMGGSGGPAAGG